MQHAQASQRAGVHQKTFTKQYGWLAKRLRSHRGVTTKALFGRRARVTTGKSVQTSGDWPTGAD